MQACFIGHRKIENIEKLKTPLKEIIISLVKKGVNTFLFGSRSNFNELSLKIVTEIKKDYSCIKRVYVRSAFQFIDESYEKYLLKFYDETYFPQKIENSGKYSYVERNYLMIDNSTYCIFYYDKNYTPPQKPLKNNMLPPPRNNSGTKIAYNYAVKKKKEIINLYEYF